MILKCNTIIELIIRSEIGYRHKIVPNIAKKVMERRYFILDTHLRKYDLQAICMFYAFDENKGASSANQQIRP